VSEFRFAPAAEAELDGIWLYIVRESGSVELATRVVEGITQRFWLLARFGRDCAAFPLLHYLSLRRRR